MPNFKIMTIKRKREIFDRRIIIIKLFIYNVLLAFLVGLFVYLVFGDFALKNSEFPKEYTVSIDSTDTIKIKTPMINKPVKIIKPKIEKKVKQTNIENKLTNYLSNIEVWKDGGKTKYPKEHCRKIAKAIVSNCKYPYITTGIIYTESKLNHKAENKHSKALGLGQITKIHKKELLKKGIIDNRFSELTSINKNVKAINFILLNKLEITNGNMKKALILYSGNANKYTEKVLDKAYEAKKYCMK